MALLAFDPTERVLVATPDLGSVSDVRQTLAPLQFEVSAAHTAAGAIDLASRCHPAVVVADVELGGPAIDLQFADVLRTRWGASIILMTGKHDRQTMAAMAPFGSCGVLRKPLDPRQLELTLLLAMERRLLADNGSGPAGIGTTNGRPPSTLEGALRRIAAEVHRVGLSEGGPPRELELLSALRPREQQVVGLLVRHYRVPAIARELGITPETVRNHLKRVFRQAGVHSQQELLERIT